MINNAAEDFTRRTDALAFALKLSLRDLSAYIGISRAALHTYRNGDQPVSKRSWRKLRTAEEKASLVAPLPEPTWKEVEAVVRTIRLIYPSARPADVLNAILKQFPMGPEETKS